MFLISIDTRGVDKSSGPTGAYWWRVGSSHTQWAPHQSTPPGQGGIQILAAATVADVVVVDVPVNMQHKFPQYWCFIQFINRVVVSPVATQRQVCTALLCRRPLRFHSCSFWTSLSFPFVQRQVLVQTVQKNGGIAAGAAPVVLWTSL